MSREVFSFECSDISALARSLREQIQACPHTPGHVEVLTMLARATGWRNFQHFRAHAQRREVAPGPAIIPERLIRLRRFFDAEGRLVRWPPKEHQRVLCLWILWSRLPRGHSFTEKEMTLWLADHHTFSDPALLRRWLVDWRLMRRTPDGRDYRRIEQAPPPEALAAIRQAGR
ncbi:DUF2087 domain-containing protein [Pararhodospirillum photometricum]|uniref:DUF2087 domain-containing protein n=1 Tax=Pararhodospirillum photometricum DSM 122 TaxID=1150469 RepID=H6SR28_PARPM|nr:DUF2087 domain-containing protein [Pararhodospirillum photometricum]CCG09750.1 Putative uncharacterized protein [Pararhodospirillum photometricum DSM 122]